MNINNKEVIILGVGRFQKDFEYMFPDINITAYITLENVKEDMYNSKKCYSLNKVTIDLLKNKIVVVCDRRNKEIDNILFKFNLKEKRDFVYMEDLAYLLDDKKEIIVDKIYSSILTIYLYIKIRKKYKSNYKKNSILFKKMIYTDSYDGFNCRFPFEYVNIQYTGKVYSCCESWGEHAIGNLFLKKTNEIWNSNAVKLRRLSIINKTYCFCDKGVCPYLNESMEKTNTRFADKQAKEIPEEVYISIDKSCNLHCKSCRDKQFNAKGLKLKKATALYKKLDKCLWLSDSKRLVIAGQGEVFYSKIYQKMLFESSLTKRDNIEILTNGTLLNKNKLDKLCSIYKEIKISITMDAINENTYRNIRHGGNFNALMNNLKYICEIRKQGKIKELELFFVVQRKNYKEMIKFIKTVKALGVDKIGFSQICNWGTFTDKEFKKVSMLDENGQPKVELKKILKNKIFKDPIVNYTNITKFIE